MSVRLLVIGHWMSDHIMKLPKDISLLEPLQREHIHVDIISQIGGSGYHFSVGARKAGFKDVTSIVCSNSKEHSLKHSEVANMHGINVILYDSALSHAQAVLIYDAGGRRSSFGTRGENLDLPYVSKGHLQKNSYDVIFIAGHLLEDFNAQESVKELIILAKESGAFVVFDLVPHHIHRLYKRSFFYEIFPFIDGLISKQETICPIIDNNSFTNSHDTADIINNLLTQFKWVCIQKTNHELTIGHSNNAGIYIYSAETGYSNTKIKAGALDYPVARELFHFIVEQNIGNM